MNKEVKEIYEVFKDQDLDLQIKGVKEMIKCGRQKMNDYEGACEACGAYGFWEETTEGTLMCECGHEIPNPELQEILKTL